jgi:transketolase
MENLAGIRDSYGQAIVDLAQEDERIVVLASDSKYSSKLDLFEQRFPDRFFEVGVCEQNMVGMAAGLSLSGRIPFVSAISCFMSMRCYEVVRTAVGYPKLKVNLVGMSSGFAYPQLGATHTCLEDVSIMRAASNISVISPADNSETYAATRAMAAFEGPVYMRLGRHPVPDIYDRNHKFMIGKGSVLQEGGDASIIAVGPVVPFALEAHVILKREGIRARVINMSSIKPLDESLVMRAATETGHIVTVEEHNIAGGMGSAVAELLIQRYPVKMKLLGVPNETPNPAPRDVLLDRYHLTAPAIAAAVRALL